MRALGSILGMLLLVLAVVLTTGGVAVRLHADPASPAAPEVESEETLEASVLLESSEGVCRPPEPIQRKMALPFSKPREGDVIFTLNTRGYNYSRPDVHRPAVPDGTPPANIKRHAD